MKRLILLSSMSVALLALVQCSPKMGSKTTDTSSSTTSAATNNGNAPHSSDADIAKGQVIFQNNCGRCHKLFAPESRTVEQWNRILPPMYRKAQLDDAQAALVAAYVLPKAKKS